MTLTVGSLFSGVGGIDLGFERAGMRIAFQAEADPWCRSILAHHYPGVTLYDDVRAVPRDAPPVDIVAGGFPCQDLSTAGRRAGLAGARSGLFHEAVRIIRDVSPRWVLLENVPGLLSSNRGEDFAVVLGELTGYRPDVPGKWLSSGWCGGPDGEAVWRVLDSQNFGVAQRRRRVFVVVRLGDECPREVLLERPSGSGNPAPGGEARADAASRAGICAQDDGIARTLTTGQRYDGDTETFVADTVSTLQGAPGRGYRIDAEGAAGGQLIADTLRSHPRPGSASPGAIAFHATQTPVHGAVAPTLGVSMQVGVLPEPATAWAENSRAELREMPVPGALSTGGGKPGQGHAVARIGSTVRRLTPRECERLQGFPDDWTLIEGIKCSDSRRYAAMGNAVTVPVLHWIGERIVAADLLTARHPVGSDARLLAENA